MAANWKHQAQVELRGPAPAVSLRTATPTHRRQAAGAFTDGGTAADQPDDEKKRPHGDDDDSRDQSVNVLKEVVVVVIGDEHVGADVAEDPSGRLDTPPKVKGQ